MSGGRWNSYRTAAGARVSRTVWCSRPSPNSPRAWSSGPWTRDTPARWVAGDEVYGDNPHLRAALEDRRTGYVLAVSSTHPVVTRAWKFQAKALAARIPKRAWQRLSAGAGAKGERYYDWAQIDIHNPIDRVGQWCLLVRRNRRTGELAFYRCFSSCPMPMSELVRVAGRR
ncbi:hypothetical protein [Streptomyces sp. NPDC056160]|uniref:hypothetical protein n=1 Tax=Streptomyces sp. NPDC056160 TaxID=3345731 RepID=UPI0035D9445E